MADNDSTGTPVAPAPLVVPAILNGVHPALIRKIQAIEQALKDIGFPIQVVQGVRTAEYQAALYAQGRTAPGHIVTNCDGITNKSNHQAKADGFGHAIDVAFLDANSRVSFDDHWPWRAYGELGKALGLTWGGDFKSLADLGHLELKLNV